MADGAFKRFTNRLLEPGNVTDQKVRENRQMADLILNQSTQPQPIQHPLQGAALLMNALNSQVLRQRANRGEEALKKQRAQEMGSFLQSLGVDPQQAEVLRNAPEGVRDNLLGEVAASRLLPGEQANPFAKINPKDFSQESVAEFQRTGDFSVLKPVAPSGGDTARQRRIAAETERLRRLGFERPEERATAVVDGILSIGRDTVTGLPQLEDAGTGQVFELAVNRPAGPDLPAVEPSQTLWELAEKATGGIPSAKAAGSQVSGTFGGPISEETVEARQTFQASQNTVIRAFSLNPRYPVAEQKRILDNINIEPGVFDHASLMRSRMRGIDQFLKNEADFLENAIQQPGVSRQQRSADEQTLRSIKAFRRQMGVPERVKETEAPEGVPQSLWDVMTPEERALWQN